LVTYSPRFWYGDWPRTSSTIGASTSIAMWVKSPTESKGITLRVTAA
jgi:hypothetical protein